MQDVTNTLISDELLESAYTYEEFNELIQKLYDEDRTTNEDNRPNMLDYTKMYMQRSNRWDRRGKLTKELKQKLKEINRDMVWLVINEGWCGDGAQTLPFINKMAEETDKIDLRVILRDQNLDVMDRFLTNGARSVPKLIAIEKSSGKVLGTWGPRPFEANELYWKGKNDPDTPNKTAVENLHLWYAKDRGKSIQQEFLKLLDEWGEAVQ
ncbi:thioredoxin family protein [Gracilimonas amylolytica]|uniref:thioredoxin family protein n=1 Tax=Gracilimonas amylolytica TaxID=1749045 RepID=UPI000CD86141|nr:thioredoxin family protein [Gracilimonas amylolytica]